MDKVTRPKRAAKRLSQAAVGTLMDKIMLDGERKQVQRQNNAVSVESDKNETIDDGSSSECSPIRRDLKSVRRSRRAEVRNIIDYDTKRHPQDHAISGRRRAFSRRARQSETALLRGHIRPLRVVISDSEGNFI